MCSPTKVLNPKNQEFKVNVYGNLIDGNSLSFGKKLPTYKQKAKIEVIETRYNSFFLNERVFFTY